MTLGGNWNETSEFERRSCLTKRRYKTEPPLPSMMFRAYHCDFCQGWHLARRFKTRNGHGELRADGELK